MSGRTYWGSGLQHSAADLGDFGLCCGNTHHHEPDHDHDHDDHDGDDDNVGYDHAGLAHDTYAFG